MADPKHLKIIKQGVEAWNKWRDENDKIKTDHIKAVLSGTNVTDVNEVELSKAELIKADLSGAKLNGADLSGANLIGVNFSGVNFSGAKLSEAELIGAKLSGAKLSLAVLISANLSKADLSGADLSYVDLSEADLSEVNLSNANLSDADLIGAGLNNSNLTNANLKGDDLRRVSFIEANLEGANLSQSSVYGISARNLKTNEDTEQFDIVITDKNEPTVTVDNLEVTQFIYLILNRENLRNVLNTITSKSVLILGRFTPERKFVLDAIANELRKHNLLPIIFDFERSTDRDFTETIKILAGMSLFVIADITNSKSAPLELQATIPDYQIAFVPIIEEGENTFSMFSDLKKYDWVLRPVVAYSLLDSLLKGFKEHVIDRAWKKHQELQKSKARVIEVLSVDNFTTADKDKINE
jgi:uncharacterized protein YjbI with pentapeptide repeats